MPPNSIAPIVRIAELEVDPNQIAAYHALLSEEIEASIRIEPGVLFLYAISIKGSPEKIRVIEAYADRAAYDAHLTTPHFLKYKTHTESMVKSLRLFETDPIILESQRSNFELTHYLNNLTLDASGGAVRCSAKAIHREELPPCLTN